MSDCIVPLSSRDELVISEFVEESDPLIKTNSSVHDLHSQKPPPFGSRHVRFSVCKIEILST